MELKVKTFDDPLGGVADVSFSVLTVMYVSFQPCRCGGTLGECLRCSRKPRAGPSKCGVQCKTYALGPSEQWCYDVIVLRGTTFLRRCYINIKKRSNKQYATVVDIR